VISRLLQSVPVGVMLTEVVLDLDCGGAEHEPSDSAAVAPLGAAPP
jgi:hypothetical protein